MWDRRDVLTRGGVALLGLLLALLAAGVLLVDPESPPGALRFVGRFHPLLVHFPIGFLLLGAALEGLSTWVRPFRSLRRATAFVLFLGAASALLAVAAGFVLSLEGGYDARLVTWHKWLGLLVAAGAVAAFLLRVGSRGPRRPVLYGAYAAVLAATVVMVAVVGHLGGSLTHGPQYLTYYLPPSMKARLGLGEGAQVRRITNIRAARIYPDLVFPILQERCVECHGASREKGGLRLDTPEGLLAGGDDGRVVVAGRPEESALWRRLTLPPEHEDAMPPDGAEPLDIGETELIRWWIQSGASMSQRVAEVKEVPPSVATLFSRLAPPRSGPELALFEVPPPDSAALRSIRAAGFGVQGVAQELPVVQVSTFKLRGRLSDADLPRLLPIARQVTWIDLAGTRVGDAGLATVAKMPHLTRLHLEHTAVGDAGLAKLKGLEHLEYLNLVGTRVTDEGLRHLEGLTSLKVVYLWQTRVTQSGVRRLQDRLPELQVILETAST